MALFAYHPDLVWLKAEEIINRWHMLVPDAAGRGEKFLEEVERQVKEAVIPKVATERKEVDALPPGKNSKKLAPRIFLLICGTDAPVGGHQILVGAHDYGKYLLLSRYVMSTVNLDFFDAFEREEVSAYLSLVHSTVVAAAKQFTNELNQDFSKLNSKSEGVIDIV